MSTSVTVTTTPPTLPKPGRLGWHWLADNRRLAHSRRKVLAGRTYHVDPPVVPCSHGLHASASPLDALVYAPGAVICRVWSSGEVVEDGHKCASSYRAVLWLADASATLHEFACSYAEMRLLREREAGREPDPRLWAAIACKRGWLAGEASGAELAGAREAAWDAARDVSRSGARDAAREAIRGAAWAAVTVTSAAPRDAALDVARSAARGAAWGAAWGEESVLLTEMLMTLAPLGWEEGRYHTDE